ncbi:MAG: hypothetical protein M2R45_00335 [Verrucomicrobia subdivision 3 bacterium]|nr:hypothetical protein [Limisphaerales bacterium]
MVMPAYRFSAGFGSKALQVAEAAPYEEPKNVLGGRLYVPQVRRWRAAAVNRDANALKTNPPVLQLTCRKNECRLMP